MSARTLASVLVPLLALTAEPIVASPTPQDPPTDTGADGGQDTANPPIPFDPTVARAMEFRDWVMGIAGNDAVLRSDVDIEIMSSRELQQLYYEAPDNERRREVLVNALQQRLETLVKVQAGKDLGFDPKTVEELTSMAFERKIEEFGGGRAASQVLRGFQFTPERFKDFLRDGLLASSWESSVKGTAPGVTGRVAVDRHVRPGWVHSAYEAFQRSESREERQLVGMRDEQVQLQILKIDVADHETVEKAKELASGLVELYRSGEAEFDYLVRQYGSRSTQEMGGKIQPLDPPELMALSRNWHDNEDVWNLGRTGKIGDAIDPLLRGEGKQASWFVYRLVGRLEPTEVVPFSNRAVQQGLHKHLLEVLDDLRVQRSFGRALRDSFVWPDGLRGVIAEGTQRDR